MPVCVTSSSIAYKDEQLPHTIWLPVMVDKALSFSPLEGISTRRNSGRGDDVSGQDCASVINMGVAFDDVPTAETLVRRLLCASNQYRVGQLDRAQSYEGDSLWVRPSIRGCYKIPVRSQIFSIQIR